MVAAREHGFAAERTDGFRDARVVGGHNHAGDGGSLANAFKDMLDHRPARNGRERLAGKAAGSVACGDDRESCGLFRSCHGN